MTPPTVCTPCWFGDDHCGRCGPCCEPDPPCPCGGDPGGGCMFVDCGYPWCRPCREHHRPPECSVDEDGRPLAACGCPWDELDGPDPTHRPDCRDA